MSNLFEYNYPGRYLLINYKDEFYNKLINNGYIVYRFDSIDSIDPNIIIDSIDYFYIGFSSNQSESKKLQSFIEILKIKKIIISIDIINKIHIDFINFLITRGYQKTIDKPIKEGDETLELEFINNKFLQCNFKPDKEIITFRKKLDKIVNYICPGDEILIIDSNKSNIRNYISYKINSNKINFIKHPEISTRERNKKYNFIIFTNNDTKLDSNIIELLSESLLPSGRCVLFNKSTNILKLLKKADLDLESHSSNISSSMNSYSGTIKDHYLDTLIFMKNPLIYRDFKYNESIYGYSSPPDNLLAFQRDYINPWIVRALVEFPSRNKSIFNLRNYCNRILETYPLLSPDYGAALAVLGYQYLNSHINEDLIVKNITSYCNEMTNESYISPHQTRWYISLSTLLGLIYRKKGLFFKSMSWFSKAYQSSERKFSPTISTKILQSYYMNITMLLSLGKISSATILLDSSIKRITTIFNVDESELLGNKNFPFNFVMYIYHDIIDWTIKLINIKRSLNTKKLGSFILDNQSTWSSLLSERMEAINFQTLLINERDIAIKEQTKIIDERAIAIDTQSFMINERDNTIRDQAKLIDERDDTIKKQAQLIDERDDTIKKQAQLIDERDKTIRDQAQLIDERDNTISNQQKIILKLEDIVKE